MHFVEAFRALVTPDQTQFFTSTPVLLFFFFCSLPRNSSIYRGRESNHGLIITLHRSPRARSVIGDLNSILHRLQQCTQFVVHSLLGILRFRSFPPFNKIETKEGTIYIYTYISRLNGSIPLSATVTEDPPDTRFPPSNLAGSLSLISSRFNILAIMRHLA